MLVEGLRAKILDKKRKSSPFLPFTSASLSLLLRDTKNELFPNINKRIDFFFVEMRTLACIIMPKKGTATIFVHDILNRTETPKLIIRHIIIHEIIHLLVYGREIEGK